MRPRTKYHVTKHDQGWQVKREKAERASAVLDSKQEALARARELAKSQPLAQVIIHGQDGVIQTEHTYGSDPFPPLG